MRSVIFVALVLIVHVTARVKNPRVDGVSSACPGGNITCPSSMTCCELRDHSYGCCPFKNAVCCRDGVHCCPGGMQCDLEEGKCQQKSDVPLKRLLVSERANDMCPDRKSQCPSGTTCCQMSTGDYGCCPMPNAVCCSDRLHCCPSGFTCNTSAGKCYQHESNIEIPWYRKFSARPFQQSMVDENNEESESSEEIRIDEELIPMHKLSIPQPKITSLQDELCPGGRTKCPSGATCCLVSMGSYGCCPMPHATCCADRRHCCPAGLQCDVTGQKCYSETEDLVIASKKKFAATPLRHKEGIHYIAEEDDISDEILSEEEESVEDVKLCGAIRCPTKATCCSVRDPTTGQMRSRCCPLTNAVCCPNHCCPFGYECRGKKKCEKKATRHAIIDFYN